MSSLKLAVRKVLSKYAIFSGRASRSEFWWWVLFTLIVIAATRLIDGAIVGPMLGFDSFQSEAGQPLSLLVSLALLLPSIAVAARRLHDIGRSGWWLLIGLVPLIGWLVLIYFYIQPSDETNSHGSPDTFDGE